MKDVRMSVTNTDFVAIIPFLPGIHTLELNIIGSNYLRLWVFNIFPRVRCLRGNFEVVSWYNLFRHLNPTLQELDCSKVTTDCLMPLTNFCVLTLDSKAVKVGFAQLFQRNTNLTGLRVRFPFGAAVRNWNSISNRSQIKELQLEFGQLRGDMSHPIFPHLTSFSIEFVKEKSSFSYLHNFMDKLSPDLLELILAFDVKQSPAWDWKASEFDWKRLAKFTKLKKLKFTREKILMEKSLLEVICRVVSLTHLTLHVNSAECTLRIIDELYNLVEFNNNLITDNNFTQDLRVKLREKNRQLRYNGSKLM